MKKAQQFPNDRLIDFRWFQPIDWDGNDKGAPELQYRFKIIDKSDGIISVLYDWTEWETIPTTRQSW